MRIDDCAYKRGNSMKLAINVEKNVTDMPFKLKSRR